MFNIDRKQYSFNHNTFFHILYTHCYTLISCLFQYSLLLSIFPLQDSAAVQILLEVCLPFDHEKQQQTYCLPETEKHIGAFWGPHQSQDTKSAMLTQNGQSSGVFLSDLREVQCLICCMLHQMFIADPNIAKLVHFQVKSSVNVIHTLQNCKYFIYNRLCVSHLCLQWHINWIQITPCNNFQEKFCSQLFSVFSWLFVP